MSCGPYVWVFESLETVSCSTFRFSVFYKVKIRFLIAILQAVFVTARCGIRSHDIFVIHFLFITGIKLNTSSLHCAYKETLVKEMKKFVDAFYSKMSSKIPLIIEMKKEELREINGITKDMKKDKLFKLTKDAKYSLENMHCNNPAYLSTPIPGDPHKRCVHYVTAKSILQQSREWPASSSRADDTVSIDSACPSMTSMDYRSVSPGDVTYEDNRKAIEY